MKKYMLLVMLLGACTTLHRTPVKDTTLPSIHSLTLLHKYIVPYNMPFNGTTVGGLSGIDYDSARKVYYLICDDRSERQAARFYTIQIPESNYDRDSIRFSRVTYLKTPNGNVYPSAKALAPDPEAMRYNPHTGRLVWSSEGERIISEQANIINDPGIYDIDTIGRYLDSYPLPAQFHMHATENGPRRNGVFEGLGFTPNGRHMFVSLEEPRYEDGPRADLRDTTAYTRIIKYDLRTRQPIAQYAYKLEPVAHPSIPGNAFRVNGISDILVLSETQLLVMERSYSTGVKSNTIRVFKVDLQHATDIKAVNSLRENPHFLPAQKSLLLNFDDLDTFVDNVEGMTFGPILPNGHRSLIFVVDNNFDKNEETQFYIFEVEQ
ncbi:esterase-like activity of phytase family protein [Chitinophaga filiformis]|uniref:Esterase-like activity of phytase family protein n=1 Tax=Chitinophaga filiformis TaxID=104663 RepID=A0ABY4I361_CHIFI|nr:esterase-like activity of phytase family protein [Chitinophaga filiformis]UPK70300.1 esterase-like activity of phytase family protein [Chitinophaga filiformis]